MIAIKAQEFILLKKQNLHIIVSSVCFFVVPLLSLRFFLHKVAVTLSTQAVFHHVQDSNGGVFISKFMLYSLVALALLISGCTNSTKEADQVTEMANKTGTIGYIDEGSEKILVIPKIESQFVKNKSLEELKEIA